MIATQATKVFTILTRLVTQYICPLCGGSRTILSLFRLDFPTAFRVNPAVLLSLPVLLFYYVKSLTVFVRGGCFSFRVPRKWTVALLILFAAFFLLRNVLLIGFHYDPAGDFIRA